MKQHVSSITSILMVLIFALSITIAKAMPAAGDSTSANALSFLQAPPESTHFEYNENPAMVITSSMGVGNDVWANELYSVDPMNPASAASITGILATSASGDFAPGDPGHMWVIDINDSHLKRVDVNTGLTDQEVILNHSLTEGSWTVLSINKITGEFYGVATNGTASEVYLIDPVSGATTPQTILEIPAVVSGTFDGGSQLFLFDILNDEMWVLDVQTNSIALLGSAGFDGNYAQGMGFDPFTGEIYLAAYNNVDGPELRLLDQVTGNTSLIGALPGETTGFGFTELQQQNLFLQAGMDHYTVPFGTLSFGEDLPEIPQGFFDPGSEPFIGQVNLEGANSQGGMQAQQDAIINRLEDAPTPEPLPVTATVPIEMISLNLQSVEPITVQSGTGETKWDVNVQLFDGIPSQGAMNINRMDMNGGDFNMDLFVQPVLVFTNVDDPTDVRVFHPIEFGFEGLPLMQPDPFGWMAPPIPDEFDPFGEEGLRLVTQAGNEILLVPFLLREDNLFLSMDGEGQPEEWGGTGFNNSEWYYYPFTDWWNVWFYDHPLDVTRHKLVSGNLQVLPRDPSQPSHVEIIVNWSTPEWPQWPGFPEPPLPPLPDLMIDPQYEDLVIERSEPIFIWEEPIFEPMDVPIPSEYLNNLTGLFNFNPEWISIDIRGYNFIVTGDLIHICFKPWTSCEVICPEDMEVCATDEPFALTGASPAGGFYSGPGVTADGNFDPGSTNWGNNIITYTYLCPDGTVVSCDFTIYVIPPPEMICPPNLMLCYGDVVALSGGIPGGGTYAGPGISGNTFSSIATGVGSFEITYSVTDPCPGECVFYITVNPNPEVICPDDFTMCASDDPIDLMTLVSPTGGSFTGGQIFDPSTAPPGVPLQIKYTYTDPDTGCEGSCVFYITTYPGPEVVCPDDMIVCESDDPIDLASLGASPAGGTFRDALGNVVSVFDPAGAGPASYLFTYCYTDPDTGCEGCCEFAITVYPNPEIECPDDFTMCADDDPIDLMTLVTPTGGSFSGGQIFDPSTAPPGVPLQIKYTYVDPQTGCESSCIFYITVYPGPNVDCPADIEMCIDDAAITLTAAPAGGSYAGAGITGDSFSPAAAGVGVHTIEYCYTDPTTGCEGCCEFKITVHDLPEVECPDDIEVCVDEPEFVLSGATPAGGTYSNAAGTALTKFDPATAGVGLHAIFYDYTDPDTGCSNWCMFFIEVHPLPVVDCPDDIDVCANDPSFTLGGATPTGGTYSNAMGNVITTFNPATAGVGAHAIFYDYTDPDTGCENWCVFFINVLPLPDVDCPADFAVCEDDPAFALGGGAPAGGVYSGPGVAGGNFNPAVAGDGVHTIKYTVTDPATGCTNSCTFKITVHKLPDVDCPANITVCENDPAFALAGATPAGGVYSDVFGVPVAIFNPAAWGVGVHTIFYDYTDPATGCANWCSFTITVNPLPVVTCPGNMSVCIDEPLFALAGATPAGGTYTNVAGLPIAFFDPATAGVGPHLITYTYTDPNTNCTNTCSFTITVNPLPTVVCPPDTTVHVSDTAWALTGGTPVGGVYSDAAGNAIAIFDPAAAGIGNHPISYEYTDVNGCSDTCTFIITVIGQQDEIDFGDAPDGVAGFSYNTLLANMGARHIIDSDIYLGNRIDAETDGQPTFGADGDDLATSDDEDGVTLPMSVTPGSLVTISVVASIDGYLDGWMDFNLDGTWMGPSEHIFVSQFVTAGANVLTFTVPAGANYGETYIRFRFRDYAGPISYLGLVQNGEVEDYRIKIDEEPQQEMDFGDVPDNGAAYDYHTLTANNGARHIINPDVFMGNLIDAEGDGQPNIPALGDDNNNLDDEDGVRMRRFMAIGDSAKVSVKASVDGFLNAWIDFNRDGKWSGPAEQIFTDQPLVAGWNTLKFHVPTFAEQGRSYARFRFNTTGGLTYEGLAQDGEVEDYNVAIFPAGWGFDVTDLSHLIVVPVNVNQVLKNSETYILQPNDALGLYYNDSTKNGGGGLILPGEMGDDNQVLIAYGDDPTTPEKEGFEEGEMMKFRVWVHATGEEFDAEVMFDPDQPNADGAFHNNGLSALTGIELQTMSQTLELPEGWSGLSTYLEPDNTNVEEMFAPVEDDLVVLYKLNGSVYWPAENLNTMNQWDTYDGHVIKMSQDAVLEVAGTELADKTVQLQQGINLIPVLSNAPVDVEVLFGAEIDLVLVKEVAGTGVYLPQWNINTLGAVVPGSAYFVVSNNDGTINFEIAANKSSGAYPNNAQAEFETPWNSVEQTPGSHVVVFNLRGTEVELGDVIGGFTTDGYCAGVAQVAIAGESLALNLNAADPFDESAAGFESGEEFTFKLYREITGEIFDLEVEYSSDYNVGTFTGNGLSEIIDLKTSSSGLSLEIESDISVYPNPSTGIFNLSANKEVEFIEILDAYGKLVISQEPGFDNKVDLTGHPTGVYFLKVTLTNRSESLHKLIVR